MFNRILVPLDGSKLAEQILPYVRITAGAFQTPIHLLSIVSMLPFAALQPMQNPRRRELINSLLGKTLEYLSEVKASLDDLGVPISYAVQEGDTPSWIVREAEQDPGTLIAISTHGRSGITRWIMGSVTNDVLHASQNPILVIRSQDERTYRPEAKLEVVVVPLDGSPGAESILPYAAALAKALDLKVVLTTVPSPSFSLGTFDRVTAAYESILEAEESYSKNYLRNVASDLRRRGLGSVSERVAHGHVPTAVVDVVKDYPDCLVALASHGRIGFERWAVGSVADHVVRRSGEPVLVVPRSAVEKQAKTQARHLMNSPVVTTGGTVLLSDAARMMLDRNISCLPVLGQQGQLVGLLTESDFALQPKFLVMAAHEYGTLLGQVVTPNTLEEVAREMRSRRVSEVMKAPVVTVQENMPLATVAELMLQKRINHLPVMRGTELVGIITSHDLLKLTAGAR